MQSAKRNFHELLSSAREAANQSVEVMGVMLNMTDEEYEALEKWNYPTDEVLKRLCLMNEWNYYDTQRLIINEMISPTRPAKPPQVEKSNPVKEGWPPTEGKKFSGEGKTNTLGDRLREVRLVTGQSIEIIALLLNSDIETYKGLEEGESPSDELLRQISVIYNWNYHDLISVLRSQHAKKFQPARVGMPFLGSSANSAKLRQVLKELEGMFIGIPEADQGLILTQLELIRESVRRNQKAS